MREFGTRQQVRASDDLDLTNFLEKTPQLRRQTPIGPSVPLANTDLHSNFQLNQILSRSESRLMSQIEAQTVVISQKDAERLFLDEIKRIFANKASSDNKVITIEALSGKLKIDKDFSLGNAKITGGEINIYKVAVPSAILLTSCAELKGNEYKSCAKAAIAEFKKSIAHDFLDIRLKAE